LLKIIFFSDTNDMPHTKILPMWKRLTKIRQNKKLPEGFRKPILKPRPFTHFGKPLWVKDWERELLPVTSN